MHHRRRECGRCRSRSAPWDARAGPFRPGYGTVIWPSCMWPASTRSKRPGSSWSSTRGKWQSRIRKSASRESAFGSVFARRRTISRGCVPAIQTERPRSSRSARLRRAAADAGSSSRRSDARACGSREIAMSWLPSTANAGCGSRADERAKPRLAARMRQQVAGDRRRAPAAARRSSSTARSTARAPRDGTPRWKSERCAMRRPSSSGGSPGTSTSSSRSRTQPASNQPQPRPAAAAAPEQRHRRGARGQPRRIPPLRALDAAVGQNLRDFQTGP